MTAKLHTFNGEQLTVRQINQRVPCLNQSAIRAHLSAGRNTTMAMLRYNPKSLELAGANRGAAKLRAQSWAEAEDRKSRRQSWKQQGMRP